MISNIRISENLQHFNFLKKWGNIPFKGKCCVVVSPLIVICASILVGIKAYNVVPMGDDLLYRFILDDKTLWSNNITYEIRDLGDAVNSQYNQYFVTNGRTLVHILVQMFAGPWGPVAFGIFIGCIFGISMILLVIYTIPKGKRYNPVIWLLITICLLYFVQGNGIIWTRLAAGINYLYPMVLTLSFLIVDKNVNYWGRLRNRLWIYPFLGLLGFITGWSHESYCIPLSGAIFIRICVILYKHEIKNVSSANWIMYISLWIGSAILVFAPGNFIRVAESPRFFNTLIKGISFLITTKTFLYLCILLACLAIFNRAMSVRLIKERTNDILMLLFSIIFGMIANTGAWSFIGVSFFSVIILFDVIGLMKLSYNYISLSIGLLGFIPIIIHQSEIIETMQSLRNVNERFINLYKQSPNEILVVPTVDIPANVADYVYNWYSIGAIDEVMKCLNICHFNRKNNAKLFYKNDYKAYMGIPMGKASKKSKESVEFYNGDRYIWLNKDVLHPGDTLVLTYLPSLTGSIGMMRKLKRSFSHSDVPPEQECIILPDSTVLVGKGALSGVRKDSREIIDIKINANNPNEENLDTRTDVQ